MMVMAGWLKGCAPKEDSCEGMKSTVRQCTWCFLLLVVTVLFLLFVMSVMVFNLQKFRASLSRYKIAWKEIRAELNLRRSEDPMTIAGDADTEDEGEEEEADDQADDNDDEPHDDDDVPVTGARHDTPRPRRRIAQKSNGDSAAGRGSSSTTAAATTPAEDEEAPTRPERSVQNEVGHTMEAPEDDEENEEVEEEEMREEEESEEPSSSIGREPMAPRRRGTEAEREAMMENDIFRPSLSDMVAEDLVNFGLRPQQMIENNEANSGRGWFVLGSIQAMLPWGEDGIPFNEEEFDEFRRRLLNEGHGPEISLTLACKNLNEFIRELEYQRDPGLRQEIKDARNTLKYLQHLLLLCGRRDGRAYNAATITFNKWMESGNSLNFFDDNETLADEEKADDGSEAAESSTAMKRAEEMGECEDPDAWVDMHYPKEEDNETSENEEVEVEEEDGEEYEEVVIEEEPNTTEDDDENKTPE